MRNIVKIVFPLNSFLCLRIVGAETREYFIQFICPVGCQQQAFVRPSSRDWCSLLMAPRAWYLENKATKSVNREVTTSGRAKKKKGETNTLLHSNTSFYRLLSYIRKVGQSFRRNDFPLHRLTRSASMNVIGVQHS